MNASPTAASTTAPVPQPDGTSPSPQRTLAAPFTCKGVGLHTGEQITVTVNPSAINTGFTLIRSDLPGTPAIPATADRVSQTVLSTLLTDGEATVQTVEHLLAALTGMGISNATIQVNGSEIPLMDGSAQEWVRAIAQAGIVEQAGDRPLTWLDKPLSVQHGDAFVAAFPAAETRFTYGIDFESAVIGNQWHSWSPGRQLGDHPSSFADDIAPARTFGFAEQVEYLRSKGLIKGGSLDNALVCTVTQWLNPPLRFTNEPARHKLLDLIGDLSLLGTPPIAHYLAYKASHGLHVQLAKLLGGGE